MSGFTRFAIYYLPPPGPLADFGAAWLGWDVARGCAVAQPDVPGIGRMTKTPRKYGFHATLKAPFALRPGMSQSGLEAECADFAAAQGVVAFDGLRLGQMGRMLALVPVGESKALRALASGCVQRFDAFRRPAEEAYLARRRAAGLNAVQDAYLLRWGYPYVLEEFRFHMTLTGGLREEQLALAQDHLRAALPDLPTPFVIDRIALVGQREDGFFQQIRSFALTG